MLNRLCRKPIPALRPKNTVLIPDREQHVKKMAGFILQTNKLLQNF
jgi:hypothetical protein